MRRAVVVLGGNAFVLPGQRLTIDGQLQFAHDAMRQLEPLLREDIQLLISHGNGPQVGHILIRVEQSLGKAYSIPLEVCVAESEGELGHVLELALRNVHKEFEMRRSIAALLTQVVVASDDPAFRNPSKPIGVFYTEKQAEELRQRGFAVRPDSGRGYRRVVPSPLPCEVLELDVIQQLLSQGTLVIAAGGGGIPVVRDDGRLRGIEAVIDKDLTAALLADQLNAELLLILTDVPCAYQDFGSENQQPIKHVATHEASRLIAAGHFAPGSMLPKMQAAAQFANRPGRRTVICNPSSLNAALQGTAGTTVEYSATIQYCTRAEHTEGKKHG